jgi:hypothetical protein
VKTKNVMSRFSITVQPPQRFATSRRPRLAEALFYTTAGAILLAWALTLVAQIAPKLASSTSVQNVLLRNAGGATLIFALSVLSAVALYGAVSALRARSLPAPSSSMLLVTAAALRTLQILTEGNVTLVDANILGALFLAAALLYYGQTKIWWFLLMPLALLTSFSPLAYLEYFRGASVAVLSKAVWMPLAAFAIGSILMALRELRARSVANVTQVKVLKLRGENTIGALRAMEADLKNLRSILAGEATEVASLKTTEFAAIPAAAASVEQTEASSVDEIDMAARRVVDEARDPGVGRPGKLSLTAPVGAGLPIAVRGSIPAITAWMKSAILTSIESLGGFPDGTVRVSIRPSISALQILVEDNGRGFGESVLAKMGQSEDRISLSDVRTAVERLGGRFEIQSRLGVGSRLSIELPRVDAFANSPRAPRSVVLSPIISNELH